MLRYAADRAAVVVVLGASAVFVGQWWLVGHPGPLTALAVLLALPVASLAHNHNHLPISRSRALNVVLDYWFTCAYGLPKLSWAEIHNRVHHVHGNRPGLDVTSTHGAGDRADLLGLLVYVPVCFPGFLGVHGRALARAWREDRRQLAWHASHLVLLYGLLALALAVAWKKALLFIVLPQQAGITAITVFNYCQHVRTDHGSRTNLARNFLSPILNRYLFNAGYHTIHHLKPTLHWSLAPAGQARVASEIDPRLCERSFWGWFVREIVAGPFLRRARGRRAVAEAGP